ncbi:MAG: hypothetical protein P1U34_05700 [Coxiellaceae bacterium]|nr:hypothetical protein [Coxiellaceae bacterium]
MRHKEKKRPSISQLKEIELPRVMQNDNGTISVATPLDPEEKAATNLYKLERVIQNDKQQTAFVQWPKTTAESKQSSLHYYYCDEVQQFNDIDNYLSSNDTESFLHALTKNKSYCVEYTLLHVSAIFNKTHYCDHFIKLQKHGVFNAQAHLRVVNKQSGAVDHTVTATELAGFLKNRNTFNYLRNHIECHSAYHIDNKSETIVGATINSIANALMPMREYRHQLAEKISGNRIADCMFPYLSIVPQLEQLLEYSIRIFRLPLADEVRRERPIAPTPPGDTSLFLDAKEAFCGILGREKQDNNNEEKKQHRVLQKIGDQFRNKHMRRAFTFWQQHNVIDTQSNKHTMQAFISNLHTKIITYSASRLELQTFKFSITITNNHKMLLQLTSWVDTSLKTPVIHLSPDDKTLYTKLCVITGVDDLYSLGSAGGEEIREININQAVRIAEVCAGHTAVNTEDGIEFNLNIKHKP